VLKPGRFTGMLPHKRQFRRRKDQCGEDSEQTKELKNEK
jgi:hypothetical protein